TQRAVLNILDDFNVEKGNLEETQKATINILDDFTAEKERLENTQRAVLNILDDFNVEKGNLEETQKATINILEDFTAEKERLENAQRAVLNILDDFDFEKGNLEDAQRAVLNILDDFNGEKDKVEQANRMLELKSQELNRSNVELQQARDILEVRVLERTADLEKSNAQLRAEMDERSKAEEQVKASLREKETLLREIHHRVKNNLQIIHSMLNLQLPQVKDSEAISLFKESQNRVYTMALIHEKLYQSQSMAKVDVPEYLRSLTANLFLSYSVGGNIIRRRISVDDVSLDIDTLIPCALIVNELVSNSLKHAFPPLRRAEGTAEIHIGLQRVAGNRLTLTISDNGIGLPHDLDIQNSRTMGLKLVTLLAKQLNGTVNIATANGTEFAISFDAKNVA
ncbi:MAG: hypothetical protein HY665_03415, partial [Chloroflexi bacterium]|nr:hypothetical protein [Chloroflexota bacterium]